MFGSMILGDVETRPGSYIIFCPHTAVPQEVVAWLSTMLRDQYRDESYAAFYPPDNVLPPTLTFCCYSIHNMQSMQAYMQFVEELLDRLGLERTLLHPV